MNRMAALVALILAVAVSGCVHNYQYLTTGQVMTASEAERNALLYWRADEGRLWYGRQYAQLELTPVMRVCGESAHPFVVADDGHLQLDSGANDYQVVIINEQGRVEPLEEPQRLRDGSRCAVILLDGEPVGTEALREGTRPGVAVICENRGRPDRYPAAGIYRFNPVSRERIDAVSEVPSCAEVFD